MAEGLQMTFPDQGILEAGKLSMFLLLEALWVRGYNRPFT